MPARPHNRTATASMLVGAALIGSNALMVQLAGTPPTISAFWRMLFAGILLFGYVLATGGWKPIGRSAWTWALVPALAFAADLWLWHRSIALVGPGIATLLANAQVFFMALAGVVFFGERLGLRFLAGIGVSFAGLWLLLAGNWATLPPQYHWGVWLGLGTGICYAAYNLGLRRAQIAARAGHDARAPIEQVLVLASLGSALLLGLAGVAEGAVFAIPTWRAFGLLLALAAFGHCLSWVLISRAMQHLRVAMIGLLLLLQPIVAFLLDVVVLHRVTTPREWIGLGLSLVGIFVVGLKAAAPAAASAPPSAPG